MIFCAVICAMLLFSLKTSTFQVTHSYQRNLLHTKLPSNRTRHWLKTMLWPDKGWQTAQWCASFSKAPVGAAHSTIVPFETLTQGPVCTEHQAWSPQVYLVSNLLLTGLTKFTHVGQVGWAQVWHVCSVILCSFNLVHSWVVLPQAKTYQETLKRKTVKYLSCWVIPLLPKGWKYSFLSYVVLFNVKNPAPLL